MSETTSHFYVIRYGLKKKAKFLCETFIHESDALKYAMMSNEDNVDFRYVVSNNYNEVEKYHLAFDEFFMTPEEYAAEEDFMDFSCVDDPDWKQKEFKSPGLIKMDVPINKDHIINSRSYWIGERWAIVIISYHHSLEELQQKIKENLDMNLSLEIKEDIIGYDGDWYLFV